MTLSDLEGHLPIANIFKCNFSYSCATVDEISTDKSHGLYDSYALC